MWKILILALLSNPFLLKNKTDCDIDVYVLVNCRGYYYKVEKHSSIVVDLPQGDTLFLRVTPLGEEGCTTEETGASPPNNGWWTIDTRNYGGFVYHKSKCPQV